MKEKKIKNRYYFIKKFLTADNIRTLIFCIIILILFVNNISDNTFDVKNLVDAKLLFSIIVLFFSDWIAVSINKLIQNKYEDLAKLTDDYELIISKYQLSNLLKYDYNDVSISLPYEIITNFDDGNNLIIYDNKNKMYELPKQICNCSDYIFDVHKGSVVYNNINIRLDNIIIKDKTIELYTSRTHYYDSLITNRACDLILQNGRSIREIFEPGPYIKPLDITKLSNHIGFNGLVMTSDGYIPFIVRNRDVSIAKGVLSTSISASLKTKYAVDNHTFNFTLSGLANAIYKEIYDELNINLSNISEEKIISGIKCFYRDLIECGKPQFFVYYKLNCDKEYLTKCFYGNNIDNSSQCNDNKEIKMKKDGNEILFFKECELYDSKLIIENIKEKKIYRQDRIIISNKAYKITPGFLLAIQLLKRQSLKI